MEREFDTETLGEKITFSNNWSPLKGFADNRKEAVGDDTNPSTINMIRTSLGRVIFTFRIGAIVLPEHDRIRYNIDDLVST